MNARQAVCAILVVAGVAVPWYFNLQQMGAGAGFVADFIRIPMQHPVTASLLWDLLIAFAAFHVWVLSDRRVGARATAVCLAVSWLVAFAAGFPLYLLLRERGNGSGA